MSQFLSYCYGSAGYFHLMYCPDRRIYCDGKQEARVPISRSSCPISFLLFMIMNILRPDVSFNILSKKIDWRFYQSTFSLSQIQEYFTCKFRFLYLSLVFPLYFEQENRLPFLSINIFSFTDLGVYFTCEEGLFIPKFALKFKGCLNLVKILVHVHIYHLEYVCI